MFEFKTTSPEKKDVSDQIAEARVAFGHILLQWQDGSLYGSALNDRKNDGSFHVSFHSSALNDRKNDGSFRVWKLNDRKNYC